MALQHVLNLYGRMICNAILFLKWYTHPKDAFINQIKSEDFWDSPPAQLCSLNLYVQEQSAFCSELYFGKEVGLFMCRIQWSIHPARTYSLMSI